MKKIFALAFSVAMFMAATSSYAQLNKRSYPFPDAGSYKVLKCDLHMHTIFSDGEVVPTTRVVEAWEEDLDVITITDHIEYQRYSDDVKTTDFNRSYDLAKDKAKLMGVTLIRACEITRGMPSGHLNVIGIKDANVYASFVPKGNSRDTTGVYAALSHAKKEGAFIQWNHPAYPEMHFTDTQLNYIKNGLMNGIEVVNGECYVPKAFDWCLEKGLAVMSNTDVHSTMAQKRESDNSKTMTLVLAKSNSEADVLEALFAGRTAAVWRDKLMGKESVVSEIVKSALKVTATIANEKGQALIEIKNECGMPFEAELQGMSEGLRFWTGQSVVFKGGHTAAMDGSADASKKLSVKFKFPNVFVTPTENLVLELPVQVVK